MKKLIILSVMLLSLSCTEEVTIIENTCECELVTQRTVHRQVGSFPNYTTIIETVEVRTPISSKSCGLDGATMDGGVIECK